MANENFILSELTDWLNGMKPAEAEQFFRNFPEWKGFADSDGGEAAEFIRRGMNAEAVDLFFHWLVKREMQRTEYGIGFAKKLADSIRRKMRSWDAQKAKTGK